MEAFNTSIPLPISFPTFTNTTTAHTGSNPWMDTRIWSRLPQRVIDRVIAFLPPPAFFRFRSVCKRWYGLLFSHSFLQLYLQVSPRHHWFIFFKRKTPKNHIYKTGAAAGDTEKAAAAAACCDCFLFDPQNMAWYRLSFAVVPSGFTPASSSGGLICWVSDDAGLKTLILCNPLVGSLTQLPPTIRPRLFPSIGLNVTPSAIDVAVAGDDLISPYAVKNLTAENFHIDAGGFYSMWGTTSSLPRLCSLESGRMVHVGGKFYCMNYSPFSVLAYDVAANYWCKIQAPMRRFLRSPSLVESRGRLVLVAAVEKSKLNVPRSLRLWRLEVGGTTWVEVERMPQQLYAQFAEAEGGGRGFECVGHGEFVMVMIGGSTEKGLLFDFESKRWQWIPACPFVRGGGGGEVLHGFGYKPRLATPVTALLDQFTIPFQSFNG